MDQAIGRGWSHERRDTPFIVVREDLGETSYFGPVDVTHQEMEHGKELARWHVHMVTELAEYILSTSMPRIARSTYPDITEWCITGLSGLSLKYDSKLPGWPLLHLLQFLLCGSNLDPSVDTVGCQGACPL